MNLDNVMSIYMVILHQDKSKQSVSSSVVIKAKIRTNAQGFYFYFFTAIVHEYLFVFCYSWQPLVFSAGFDRWLDRMNG